MIELYQARDQVEAQLLKDYLFRQGVEAVILNDFLSGAAGGVPANIYPTLWLLEQRELDKARRLTEQFFRQRTESGAPWVCEVCGVSVDAGFEVCWNCATPGPKQED